MPLHLQENTTSTSLIFVRLICIFCCFRFLVRRLFPHLHLGFNTMAINPRPISCYDALKKVSMTFCIGWQFLTDFNAILFLIVSQKIRHEICIWSFSVKTSWQDIVLMLTSLASPLAVKQRIPRITAWTLSTWSSSVEVEGRPDLGLSTFCSL